MKSLYITLVTICFAASFSSCTKDKASQKIIATSCTNNGLDTMHYLTDIKPILTTYCTAGGDTLGDCHQASSSLGFDYTTYDALFPYLPDIFVSYVLDPNTATMPKSNTNGLQTLSDCDHEKLQLWIDQGFPNN